MAKVTVYQSGEQTYGERLLQLHSRDRQAEIRDPVQGEFSQTMRTVYQLNLKV